MFNRIILIGNLTRDPDSLTDAYPISRLAAEVSVMPEKDQMDFFKVVMDYLPEKSKQKWMHKVMTLAQPQKKMVQGRKMAGIAFY